jgi:ArsR family transcriptional regulator, virulence genes transcriptional regulator
MMPDQPLSQLAEKAGQAAALLKALSNERRLLILCHLISAGEMTVGALVDVIGLSQSALSQHLARLRSDGLVTFRREAQTLYYRIGNPDTGRVIAVLRDIYCPELGADAPEQVPK